MTSVGWLRAADYPVSTVSQINAVLLAVGDHAYFWFDTGPGGDQPDPSTLELVADEFDLIYEDVVSYFGQEGQPGIDGDLRVHVVNASPIALCDVTLDTLFFRGLSGYFRRQTAYRSRWIKIPTNWICS